MWSRRKLVLCGALAGCADVLGLSSSVRDGDLDGIPDYMDNCPDDPNPGQEDLLVAGGPGDACDICPNDRVLGIDRDGDGRDDGCDGCVGDAIFNMDEDADGIDDGCDVCVNNTSRYPGDRDHDGIPDACDTCSSQLGIDLDRDGVDDACDICLGGPNDDEDGDGHPDACDNCPVVSNDGVTNTADIDNLGDACDPSQGNEARRLYDSFHKLELWTSDQSSFEVADGKLSVYPSPTSPVETPQWVMREKVTIMSPVFEISTRMTSHEGDAGLSVIDQNKERVDCYVAEDVLYLATYDGTSTNVIDRVTLGGDVRVDELALVMFGTYTSNGPSSETYHVDCQLRLRDDRQAVVSRPFATNVSTPVMKVWHPGFHVSTNATFEWIEVLELTDIATSAVKR